MIAPNSYPNHHIRNNDSETKKREGIMKSLEIRAYPKKSDWWFRGYGYIQENN